jgi:hypothetical protein
MCRVSFVRSSMYNKGSSKFPVSVGDRSMMDVSCTDHPDDGYLGGVPCVSLDDDVLRRSIALCVNKDVLTIGNSSCSLSIIWEGGG